ncbi:MAG: glycine zipper 2TM domain-containing protein [Betaproteobacteria bacterium]|nr:glycine zipper 2TM domain-containing protein [Betaproteobacteria bacterium]
MEARQVSPSRIAVSSAHPLLLVAAASVTLFSLAGIGAIAGWLPGPAMHGAVAAPLTAAAAAAPAPIQKKVAAPQEKTRTLAKSAENAPASAYRNVQAPAPVPTSSTVAVSPAPTYDSVSPAPTYAATSPQPAYRVAAPTPAICNECGVVEDVREIADEPKASGGGAIAGGLVGGLIANRIGKGSTRSIATVLGAAGGAYAGNYIEKSMKQSKHYEVLVRFDDGSTRTFSSDSAPAWQSGDRVTLQNGLLTKGGGREIGNPGMI